MFVFKFAYDFQTFSLGESLVCQYVCLCVCVPRKRFVDTIETIIINFGTVTASDVLVLHELIVLTLTFIQGHTYLNHGNNECLIISETIRAMPIKFAVKTKGLYDRCYSDDLYLHSRSQVRLKLDYFLACNISDNNVFVSHHIQTWHDGRLMDAIYAHARFDDLDLDARSQWVGKGTISAFNALGN